MNFACRSLVFLFALAAFLRAETPDADALWQKANDAIEALNKKPENPPATQEGMVEYVKKLVETADEAGKNFTDHFPQDPRRWKIRMFDAMTASARGQLGLKTHGDMKTILDEVVKAPDADATTKGEASAIQVLIAAEAMESQEGGTDKWMAQAEEHLKKYPDSELNGQIKDKLASIKQLAELKVKPLDLKFKAVDGREVDLTQMRGKVVLVDFWATWCPLCVAELPDELAAYQKFHEKGFEIVGISLDQDLTKLEAFTKEKQMNWPQYFDGKFWENDLASRFGVRALPAMWLVDKKGMVVSTKQ